MPADAPLLSPVPLESAVAPVLADEGAGSADEFGVDVEVEVVDD